MADKKKILIVDDEEDICYFSKSILEKTGRYTVVSLSKPVQCVETAKQYRPDLILLDLFMSELDGSKVAQYLLNEESTREIPIVFLTALVKNDEVEKHSGLIGGRPFISKPVSAQDLVARIDSFFQKA